MGKGKNNIKDNIPDPVTDGLDNIKDEVNDGLDNNKDEVDDWIPDLDIQNQLGDLYDSVQDLWERGYENIDVKGNYIDPWTDKVLDYADFKVVVPKSGKVFTGGSKKATLCLDIGKSINMMEARGMIVFLRGMARTHCSEEKATITFMPMETTAPWLAAKATITSTSMVIPRA